eukprot:scaffold288216_cov14-Tisochrysis_lutea.AAC.1
MGHAAWPPVPFSRGQMWVQLHVEIMTDRLQLTGGMARLPPKSKLEALDRAARPGGATASWEHDRKILTLDSVAELLISRSPKHLGHIKQSGMN